MPVSILDNFERFSPNLKSHYCRKVGAILSNYNSRENNQKILNRHFNELFEPKHNNDKFVSKLESWEGLKVVFRALSNFGKLPGSDAEGYLLAERFPTVLIFNREDYVLTWEFLHYLGRRHFFHKSNYLLGHLFSLTKSDLLHWASWLNPTLNEYNRLNLIEFIYTYCENFNFTETESGAPDNHERSLNEIIPVDGQASLWLESSKAGVYRFLQTIGNDGEAALYPRQFKYGLLAYRVESFTKAEFNVFIPNEFVAGS